MYRWFVSVAPGNRAVASSTLSPRSLRRDKRLLNRAQVHGNDCFREISAADPNLHLAGSGRPMLLQSYHIDLQERIFG